MPAETPESHLTSPSDAVSASGDDSHLDSTTQIIHDDDKRKTIDEAGEIAEDQVVRDLTGKLIIQSI